MPAFLERFGFGELDVVFATKVFLFVQELSLFEPNSTPGFDLFIPYTISCLFPSGTTKQIRMGLFAAILGYFGVSWRVLRRSKGITSKHFWSISFVDFLSWMIVLHSRSISVRLWTESLSPEVLDNWFSKFTNIFSLEHGFPPKKTTQDHPLENPCTDSPLPEVLVLKKRFEDSPLHDFFAIKRFLSSPDFEKKMVLFGLLASSDLIKSPNCHFYGPWHRSPDPNDLANFKKAWEKLVKPRNWIQSTGNPFIHFVQGCIWENRDFYADPAFSVSDKSPFLGRIASKFEALPEDALLTLSQTFLGPNLPKYAALTPVPSVFLICVSMKGDVAADFHGFLKKEFIEIVRAVDIEFLTIVALNTPVWNQGKDVIESDSSDRETTFPIASYSSIKKIADAFLKLTEYHDLCPMLSQFVKARAQQFVERAKKPELDKITLKQFVRLAAQHYRREKIRNGNKKRTQPKKVTASVIKRWWNFRGKRLVHQYCSKNREALVFRFLLRDVHSFNKTDKISESLVKDYAKRTGLSKDYVLKLVEAYRFTIYSVHDSSSKFAEEPYDPNDQTQNYCTKCLARPFPRLDLLLKHQGRPHPYSCNKCNLRFTRKRSLREHRILIHAPLERCSLCHATKKWNPVAWQTHLKSSHKIPCAFPECNLAFSRHRRYTEHLETHDFAGVLTTEETELLNKINICLEVPDEKEDDSVDTPPNCSSNSRFVDLTLAELNELSLDRLFLHYKELWAGFDSPEITKLCKSMGEFVKEHQGRVKNVEGVLTVFEQLRLNAPTFQFAETQNESDYEVESDYDSDGSDFEPEAIASDITKPFRTVELTTSSIEELSQLDGIGSVTANHIYKVCQEREDANCASLRISRVMVRSWWKENIHCYIRGQPVICSDNSLFEEIDQPKLREVVASKLCDHAPSNTPSPSSCIPVLKPLEPHTKFSVPHFFERLQQTNMTYWEKMKRLEYDPRKSCTDFLGTDSTNGFLPEIDTPLVNDFLSKQKIQLDRKYETNENCAIDIIPELPDPKITLKTFNFLSSLYISSLTECSGSVKPARIVFTSTNADSQVSITYCAGGRMFRDTMKGYHISTIQASRCGDEIYVAVFSDFVLNQVEILPDPQKNVQQYEMFHKPFFRNRMSSRSFHSVFRTSATQFAKIAKFGRKHNIPLTFRTSENSPNRVDEMISVFHGLLAPIVLPRGDLEYALTAEYVDPLTRAVTLLMPDGLTSVDISKQKFVECYGVTGWESLLHEFFNQNAHLVEIILKLQRDRTKNIPTMLFRLENPNVRLSSEQKSVMKHLIHLEKARYYDIMVRQNAHFVGFPLACKFKLFYNELKAGTIPSFRLHNPSFRQDVRWLMTRIPEPEFVCHKCNCRFRPNRVPTAFFETLSPNAQHKFYRPKMNRKEFQPPPSLLTTKKLHDLKITRSSQAILGHFCHSCKQNPQKDTTCIAVDRGEFLEEVRNCPPALRGVFSFLSTHHSLRTHYGHKKMFAQMMGANNHYFLEAKGILTDSNSEPGACGILLHQSQAPENFRQKAVDDLKKKLDKKNPGKLYQCTHSCCKAKYVYPDILKHIKSCSKFEAKFHSKVIKRAQQALAKKGLNTNYMKCSLFVEEYEKRKGNLDLEEHFELDHLITHKFPSGGSAGILFTPDDPSKPFIMPHKRKIARVKCKTQIFINQSHKFYELLRHPYLFLSGKGSKSDFPDKPLPRYIKESLNQSDGRFREDLNWIMEQSVAVDAQKLRYAASRKRVRREYKHLAKHLVTRKMREDGSVYATAPEDQFEGIAGATDNSPEAWHKRRTTLKHKRDSLGRDPDLMITITTNPMLPELQSLFERNPQYKTFHDCPIEISQYVIERIESFCRFILFSDEGGIFPANTPFFIRPEWNHGIAMPHFHILVWAPPDFDYTMINCRKTCTPQYPFSKRDVKKLYHDCNSVQANCLRVDGRGEYYCKNDYPHDIHILPCNCGDNCRKPEVRDGERWISEKIDRLFYLIHGSVNVKVLSTDECASLYSTKINYVTKPPDFPIEINDFLFGDTAYQCIYCKKVFRSSADTHLRTCTNKSEWQCCNCKKIITNHETAIHHLQTCKGGNATTNYSDFQKKKRFARFKSEMRPIMTSAFSLDHRKFIMCNITTYDAIIIPPWDYCPVIVSQRALQKRSEEGNMDNLSVNKFEHWLRRPKQLSITLTNKLHPTPEMRKFILDRSDCSSEAEIDKWIEECKEFTFNMLTVNFIDFWSRFSGQPREIKLQAAQNCIRTHSIFTAKDYNTSFLFWKLLHHPVSTSWHASDRDAIPTKSQVYNYALMNGVIDPEIELFERIILESKHIPSFEKINCILHHVTENISFNSLQQALTVKFMNDANNYWPSDLNSLSIEKYKDSMCSTTSVIYCHSRVLNLESLELKELQYHPTLRRVRESHGNVEFVINLNASQLKHTFYHLPHGSTQCFPPTKDFFNNFIIFRVFKHPGSLLQYVCCEQPLARSRFENLKKVIEKIIDPVLPTIPTIVLDHHAVNYFSNGFSTDLSYNKLSGEQKKVYDVLVSAENPQCLHLVGFAGTGKTALSKLITNELIKLSKRVACTASTGTASSLVQGCTVYKFLGMSDTSLRGMALLHSILGNAAAVQRILILEYLFLDECSMLTKDFIQSLNFVFSKIRNPIKPIPFGGVIVILCGDWLQLEQINPEDQRDITFPFEDPMFRQF